VRSLILVRESLYPVAKLAMLSEVSGITPALRLLVARALGAPLDARGRDVVVHFVIFPHSHPDMCNELDARRQG
tara:strand:- start:3206 stop:3427 length:222 start_codon:yes stop_codon:yes gene_type:complete